jgi:hypothetical protein
MKHSIAIASMVAVTSIVVLTSVFTSVVSGFLSEDLRAARRTASVAQTPEPEMTRVPQFDNDRAVSWKSVIPAHTESALHRHDRFRTVIGIVGGDLTLVDANGKKTVMHYETGKAYWQEPMPAGAMHKDVNETNKTIELIVVESK